VLYDGPKWSDQEGLYFTSLVLVGGQLFWWVRDFGSGVSGIARCAASGCDQPQFVATTPLSELSADAERLYWIDGENNALVSLSEDGEQPETIRSFEGSNLPSSLAAAGDFVYFANELGDGVYRVRKDGNGDSEFVLADRHISDVTSDGDAIYYATSLLTGGIASCPYQGCTTGPLSVVSNQRWILELQVREGSAFWLSTFNNGVELRATLKTCTVSACDDPTPLGPQFTLVDGSPLSGTHPGATFAVNHQFVVYNERFFGSGSSLRRIAR
jgi:hypothetical protein